MNSFEDLQVVPENSALGSLGEEDLLSMEPDGIIDPLIDAAHEVQKYRVVRCGHYFRVELEINFIPNAAFLEVLLHLFEITPNAVKFFLSAV